MRFLLAALALAGCTVHVHEHPPPRHVEHDDVYVTPAYVHPSAYRQRRHQHHCCHRSKRCWRWSLGGRVGP